MHQKATLFPQGQEWMKKENLLPEPSGSSASATAAPLLDVSISDVDEVFGLLKIQSVAFSISPPYAILMSKSQNIEEHRSFKHKEKD